MSTISRKSLEGNLLQGIDDKIKQYWPGCGNGKYDGKEWDETEVLHDAALDKNNAGNNGKYIEQVASYLPLISEAAQGEAQSTFHEVSMTHLGKTINSAAAFAYRSCLFEILASLIMKWKNTYNGYVIECNANAVKISTQLNPNVPINNVNKGSCTTARKTINDFLSTIFCENVNSTCPHDPPKNTSNINPSPPDHNKNSCISPEVTSSLSDGIPKHMEDITSQYRTGAVTLIDQINSISDNDGVDYMSKLSSLASSANSVASSVTGNDDSSTSTAVGGGVDDSFSADGDLGSGFNSFLNSGALQGVAGIAGAVTQPLAQAWNGLMSTIGQAASAIGQAASAGAGGGGSNMSAHDDAHHAHHESTQRVDSAPTDFVETNPLQHKDGGNPKPSNDDGGVVIDPHSTVTPDITTTPPVTDNPTAIVTPQQ